jgi:hypothetical protein
MITPSIQKTMLRLWIAAASLLSFVVGWAVLAQSPRPAHSTSPSTQQFSSSPALGLTPVPTLDPATLQLGLPVAPSASNSQFTLPSFPSRGLVFSTGGS